MLLRALVSKVGMIGVSTCLLGGTFCGTLSAATPPPAQDDDLPPLPPSIDLITAHNPVSAPAPASTTAPTSPSSAASVSQISPNDTPLPATPAPVQLPSGTQFGYQLPPSQVPLRFDLRLDELNRLRQAAQMAGGDVEITIKPVGLSMSEFIVPLQRVGFDVRVAPSGEVIVASAAEVSDLELRKASLQEEVNQLKETRHRLLDDVEFLRNNRSPETFSQN